MIERDSGCYPRLGAPKSGPRPRGDPAHNSPQMHMTYQTRCEHAQCNARRALRFMPAPRSSKDVVSLLTHAAHVGLAKAEIVSHLVAVGALYPKELIGAFRAFQARRGGDN